MDPRFTRQAYLLRKKFWTIFGAKFHVFDPQTGELLMFSKQKAFKLKEDIRIFTDETMTTELITIQARQIIDFSAAYDVTETATGMKIGALRRKGFSSLIQDKWEILDAQDQVIGMIQEDSTGLALVRRLIFNLLPQAFNVTISGQQVALFKQNWNFFVPKITLDFSFDQNGALDRRLGLAAAVLLAAVEGRQK